MARLDARRRVGARGHRAGGARADERCQALILRSRFRSDKNDLAAGAIAVEFVTEEPAALVCKSNIEYDHGGRKFLRQAAGLGPGSRKVYVPAQKSQLATGTSGEANIHVGQNQALRKIERHCMLRHSKEFLFSSAGQASGFGSETQPPFAILTTLFSTN